MGAINGYIHKDIEGFDLRHVYRDEAAMRIMDQEVAAESTSRIVIDATGTIGHIPHYQGFSSRTELGKDVGDCGGE